MDEAPQKRPTHVAIIMDGNGRWARARNLPREEGHRAGAESARTAAQCCVEMGVPYLTLYAFSTENWQRPAREVRFLMGALQRFLRQRRDEMMEEGIRLEAIGRIGELPGAVRRELDKTRKLTREGSKLRLTLALNYGGRAELVDAARALAERIQNGDITAEAIDERSLASHLYTAELPDPDLLLRTGGERRISNFLLWQCSYSELYFTDVLWPDFDRETFRTALEEFAKRERRFGTVPDGQSPESSV